jgi:hypothetical protein
MIELPHWELRYFRDMGDELIAAKPDQVGDTFENLFRFGALQLDKNPSQSITEAYLGTRGLSGKQEGRPRFPEEPPQGPSCAATLLKVAGASNSTNSPVPAVHACSRLFLSSTSRRYPSNNRLGGRRASRGGLSWCRCECDRR